MSARRRPLFVATTVSIITTLRSPAFVSAHIEEIVVTAQKREESIQDVPI